MESQRLVENADKHFTIRRGGEKRIDELAGGHTQLKKRQLDRKNEKGLGKDVGAKEKLVEENRQLVVITKKPVVVVPTQLVPIVTTTKSTLTRKIQGQTFQILEDVVTLLRAWVENEGGPPGSWTEE